MVEPAEQLREISYNNEWEERISISPEKKKQKEWVFDAWENTQENPSESPQRREYVERQAAKSSKKNIRVQKNCNRLPSSQLRQKENTISKTMTNSPILTLVKVSETVPTMKRKCSVKLEPPSIPQTPRKEMREYCNQNVVKQPIASILYPVFKKTQSERKHRRIDRFHSFVARTVRK